MRGSKGYTIIELLVSIQLTVLIFFLSQQISVLITETIHKYHRKTIIVNETLYLKALLNQSLGYKTTLRSFGKNYISFIDTNNKEVLFAHRKGRLYFNDTSILQSDIICGLFSTILYQLEDEQLLPVGIHELDENGDSVIDKRELANSIWLELDIHIYLYENKSQIKHIFQISKAIDNHPLE